MKIASFSRPFRNLQLSNPLRNVQFKNPFANLGDRFRRNAGTSGVYRTGDAHAADPAMPIPAVAQAARRRKSNIGVVLKTAAVVGGTALVIGGGVAAYLTHAAWVPAVAAFAAKVGAGLAAAGTALFVTTPVGWVIVGLLGAAAILALGYIAYQRYKNYRLKKLNQRLSGPATLPIYPPLYVPPQKGLLSPEQAGA